MSALLVERSGPLRGRLRMPGDLQIGQEALLCGQRFGTRIEAQGRAREQSLRNLVEPLRARGAQIAAQTREDGELCAPVAVAPLLHDERLHPVEIAIPQGDPATKRALLISGLYARGITAISEGLLSRDHSERALLALGLPLETSGPLTVLDTSDGARFAGFTWQVPGDFSLAAYLIAAALAVPGSDVVLEGVGLNRSRAALLDALRHSGARIDVEPKGDVAGDEPVGDLRVRAGALRGARVLGELSVRLLQDVPALLALAPASRGRIALRDAHALRAQSPDLLKAGAQLLRAFGVECTDYEDGVDVDPPGALRAATVAADAPVEIKLLGVVLGLSAEGTTRVEAAGELDALYPGLVDALRRLGAAVRSEGAA
jgi:3-phosphoshikimate 1-carboxyvinyltransferase